jgi:pimeloyl-ACP methyl ester carboxylesterase
MTALSNGATAPMLDRREIHFRMASPLPGLSLFLRYLPPERAARKERVVLYVHGGTFASALALVHRFEWGEAYLDVDPASRSRTPPGVTTPSGSFQDIFDAWAGDFPYDPALLRAPVAIIRGEWDGMCRDDDARWLFRALTSSPLRRDIKIGRGTHLLHLETGRYALYREAEAFLVGHDRAPER